MPSQEARQGQTPAEGGSDTAPASGGESLAGIVYPRVTENEILDAVNHDPFQPDRTPSPERYVLPGERVEAGTAAREAESLGVETKDEKSVQTDNEGKESN